jgi:hypothetical protein
MQIPLGLFIPASGTSRHERYSCSVRRSNVSHVQILSLNRTIPCTPTQCASANCKTASTSPSRTEYLSGDAALRLQRRMTDPSVSRGGARFTPRGQATWARSELNTVAPEKSWWPSLTQPDAGRHDLPITRARADLHKRERRFARRSHEGTTPAAFCSALLWRCGAAGWRGGGCRLHRTRHPSVGGAVRGSRDKLSGPDFERGMGPRSH